MPGSHAARILVVEGRYDLAGSLYHLLDRSGYDVEIAFAVQDAREILNRQQFDLLVCDITLPDGMGWHVLREMRSRGPVGSIALASHASRNDEELIEAIGFDRYLKWPAGFDELLVMIGELETEGEATDNTVISGPAYSDQGNASSSMRASAGPKSHHKTLGI
jgi:DNA-binding response OmpR family regulator